MTKLVRGRVQTEKALQLLQDYDVHTYDVDARLNKTQIKKLFKHIFGVNIASIRTHILPLKRGRGRSSRGYQPGYKRVLFTVQPADLMPWVKAAAEAAEKKAAKDAEKGIATEPPSDVMLWVKETVRNTKAAVAAKAKSDAEKTSEPEPR